MTAPTSKTQAETALALAEARQADMQAAKFAAEAEHFAMLTREREALAQAAELILAKNRRDYEWANSTDQYHHLYRFDSQVNDSSVEKCIERLSSWHRLEPKCAIEVMFNSPGGEVFAGMALFDFIQEIRRQDHYVITSARGMAASMAGILLQSGDHRVMGRECVMLIHEISAGAMGKIGEIEDRVELLHQISNRVINIFAGASARAASARPDLHTEPLTAEQIDTHWRRKDWWMTSDQALRHGFVDEVR